MKIKQYIILVFISATLTLVFKGKSDTQEDFKLIKKGYPTDNIKEIYTE